MQLLVSPILSRPLSSFEVRDVSLDLLSNSSTLLVSWISIGSLLINESLERESRTQVETGSMLNEEQV